METATATTNAATPRLNKDGKPIKERSPNITHEMMIQVISILLWTDNGVLKAEDAEPNQVTVSDVTRWFNEHVHSPGKPCTEWPLAEDGKRGKRVSMSVYQRINSIKKEFGDMTSAEFNPADVEDGQKTKDYVLGILETVDTDTVDKAVNYREMVGGLKSLGLFRVPANMVPGSGHIGTAGNPVTETVDPNEVKRPKL